MILVEETDNRFYIGESSLPNAGLGVFAAENIPAGSWLEIIGVQVRRNSVADHCTHYADAYKFEARATGEKVDRLVVPMGYGGMVNHAPCRELQNAEIRANKGSTKNSAAGQIVYYFIKNIKKGEEILGNYGDVWGQALQWASERVEIINQTEDTWETFLKLNLYRLGEILRNNHA
jgi:hypothetical protein